MSEQQPVVAPSVERPYYMERCLDCEAALHGRFCAECGQRATPPRPTVRELVGEAWQEFVNLDGKVATTLRLLVTRPGRLTAEALAGRRTRYVGAVRLYLLCSLLYFGATAIVDDLPAVRARHEAHRAAVAAERRAEDPSGNGEPADCRSTATGLTGALARMNCHEERDPAGTSRARRDAVPKAMFVLLPLFALIVSLAFRGHAYVEHLYFALHLHAFFFLLLVAGQAADLTATNADDSWGVLVVLASAFVYAAVAARRVYARGWLGTIARLSVAVTLYFITAMLVLLATLVVVAMTM